MSKIVLGDVYIDPITRFRGAAIATIQELYAGESVYLQPPVDDKGSMVPTSRFPVDRVISVVKDDEADALGEGIPHTITNENHSAPEAPSNEQAGEAPDAPPAPVGHSEVDLDIDGVSWNEGIHSSAGTKTQKGRWARRKNITDELYKEVTAELQRENGTQVGAVIGAITGEAPTAPPAAETKQEQTDQMTKEPPKGATLPGVITPPKGGAGVQLAQRVGRLSMKKIVSIPEVDVMAQTLGLANYRAVLDANAVEFIPLLNQMIDEAVAATGQDENA